MISISVMAVPERTRALCQLFQRLDHSWPIRKDVEYKGPWWNAKRCWMDHMKYPNGTHHIVMQDDALPCFGFEKVAERACRAWPNDPISFFCRLPDHRKLRKGDALSVVGFCWGVALCLPTGLIPEFLNWNDRIKDTFQKDDTRLSMWIADTGRRLVCPYPSIVDHNPICDSTITGRRNGHNPGSVLRGCDSIDWSGRTKSVHFDRDKIVLSRSAYLQPNHTFASWR